MRNPRKKFLSGPSEIRSKKCEVTGFCTTVKAPSRKQELTAINPPAIGIDEYAINSRIWD
ncbi:hypothetical protein GWN49_02300 [Candidatus Bathyarchaeota archaeon]|nr:hypothetical protein [Candidatus Bathyarchaeota archaeon]